MTLGVGVIGFVKDESNNFNRKFLKKVNKLRYKMSDDFDEIMIIIARCRSMIENKISV